MIGQYPLDPPVDFGAGTAAPYLFGGFDELMGFIVSDSFLGAGIEAPCEWRSNILLQPPSASANISTHAAPIQEIVQADWESICSKGVPVFNSAI